MPPGNANPYLRQGNEVTYIYACIFLAAVPLLTMGAAYGVVKLQNRKRRRYRMKQEENNNGRSGALSLLSLGVRDTGRDIK